MPLTLEEARSLITALGVKIAEDVLDRKAKAQEFKARQEKLAAEAGAKPADWRLRQDFDGVLKRAADAASKQDFATALKTLNEAGQLLQQPDAPPPPPPPPPAPEPVAAPASVVAPAPEATAASAGHLLEIWRDARERVDAQVSQLQRALRQTKDERCIRIAEMGLNGVTGKLQVGLQVALTECDRKASDPNLKAKAAAIVAQYQQFLQSDTIIDLCDTNPFGVKCDIRGTLMPALTELERTLKG
jgi:hypothetical protein